MSKSNALIRLFFRQIEVPKELQTRSIFLESFLSDLFFKTDIHMGLSILLNYIIY